MTKELRRALNVLEWDSRVPRGAVRVRISGGYVTLTGEVAWQYQKENAWKALRHLDGVVCVTNAIEILPRLPLADIKKRIEDGFKRDVSLEPDNIRIEMSGGRVTLHGKVPIWSERRAAERVT